MTDPRRLAVSLALALALAALSPGARPRAEPAAPLALTEAVVDGPKEPYVGEMLILRLRSFIEAPVARHEIEQPQLVDFDWRQYGRDVEVETQVAGVTLRGLERAIAIFPRRPGRLTIDPFTRKVELIGPDNTRRDAAFSSAPVTVEARALDGLVKPGDFFLPARSVTLTDEWEPRPDRLGLNDAARRTLTIMAEGLTADRLPPPPPMRAPGLIVFAAPAERETIATPKGLTAKAVYRYDVRPASSEPAKTPAIHVAWFDTVERRMREASLPPRVVAFVDPNAPQIAGGASEGASFARRLGAAGLGFAWAAALGLLILTSPAHVGALGGRLAFWRAPGRAELARLRRAGRRGDAAGVMAATLALSRAFPERFARAARGAGPELARLEAGLYGRGGAAPDAQGLAALSRKIARGGAARD
ncbi:hypothetical protein [Methylocella sp.]|uniref:hypothetical protein n=1 Tax=Methylocella sp. TaxID=1978226 RepID=UPI003783EFF6